MPDSAIADPDRPDANRIAELEREVAALRGQLADCAAERDEALAQQTANTEVLQVINASPGDLAPVFGAILEKATTLCDAKFGLLQLYDSGSGGFRFAAGRDLPAAVVDYFRQRESAGNPIRPLPAGCSARLSPARPAFRSRISGHGTDTAAARRRCTVCCTSSEAPGPGSASRSAKPGIVSVSCRSTAGRYVRSRTSRSRCCRISRRRRSSRWRTRGCMTETREALEKQTATAEVLQVINSSPGDLAPVFDAILDKAYATLRGRVSACC